MQFTSAYVAEVKLVLRKHTVRTQASNNDGHTLKL